MREKEKEKYFFRGREIKLPGREKERAKKKQNKKYKIKARRNGMKGKM